MDDAATSRPPINRKTKNHVAHLAIIHPESKLTPITTQAIARTKANRRCSQYHRPLTAVVVITALAALAAATTIVVTTSFAATASSTIAAATFSFSAAASSAIAATSFGFSTTAAAAAGSTGAPGSHGNADARVASGLTSKNVHLVGTEIQTATTGQSTTTGCITATAATTSAATFTPAFSTAGSITTALATTATGLREEQS